jgi:CBS domain-containing protein
MTTEDHKNDEAHMKDKKVKDWMHCGVITCRPETPIADAAAVMDFHDISALVVVDDRNEAVGVISRTDLVNARFIQPYMKHWRGLSAEHLMTKPVISVTLDTSVHEAVQLLNEKRIHRLVVIEKASGHVRPVGILSVTDLARHVGEDMKSEE